MSVIYDYDQCQLNMHLISMSYVYIEMLCLLFYLSAILESHGNLAFCLRFCLVPFTSRYYCYGLFAACSGWRKCRCCGYDEGAPWTGAGSRRTGLCCGDQDRHVPAKHPAGNAADAAQDSQVTGMSQDARTCSDGRRRDRFGNELHF